MSGKIIVQVFEMYSDDCDCNDYEEGGDDSGWEGCCERGILIRIVENRIARRERAARRVDTGWRICLPRWKADGPR